MAQTPPPGITPPPTPAPQRGDRATFSQRVDAFIAWLTASVAQFAATATNVYNNAVDAFNNATAAAGSASSASTNAGLAQTAATAAASSATGLIATSNSSVSIGAGAKSFTVPAGKMFMPGIRATAVNPFNTAQSVSGPVASYSGTTLVIGVDDPRGSGTVANWNISVTAQNGAQGLPGATGGVNGGSLTSALNFKQAANINVTATPNIWDINGNLVKMVGPGTITGFSAAPQAGARRTLLIDGAVTLTDGANLIVQGGTRTLGTGDMVEINATDSTTVFRATIQRASGLAASQPAQNLTLLGTAVVSTPVANVDFLNVFTADYDWYAIEFTGLIVSASGDGQLRFAKSGVVDAGSNYYSSTTATAQSRLFTATAANVRFSGVADIFGINDPARCGVVSRGVIASSTQHLIVDNVGGGYETGGGTVTGFRLLHSTGANFTGGTVRVYGIRNAAGVV